MVISGHLEQVIQEEGAPDTAQEEETHSKSCQDSLQHRLHLLQKQKFVHLAQ
jgi:hypothetical protein